MYLAIDSETGGIDPKTTCLLTATFFVLDHKFELVDKLESFIKYPVYQVSAGALNVNKINLVEHEVKAKERSEVGFEVDAFLAKYSRQERLTVIGQNVAFDIGFLKEWLPEVNWSTRISYRVIDTYPIAQYLQLVGLLPFGLKLSLGGLAEHFQIEHENAHDATADVITTVAVLKKMLDLRQLIADRKVRKKNGK